MAEHKKDKDLDEVVDKAIYDAEHPDELEEEERGWKAFLAGLTKKGRKRGAERRQ